MIAQACSTYYLFKQKEIHSQYLISTQEMKIMTNCQSKLSERNPHGCIDFMQVIEAVKKVAKGEEPQEMQ